jgi:hypothetical protein
MFEGAGSLTLKAGIVSNDRLLVKHSSDFTGEAQETARVQWTDPRLAFQFTKNRDSPYRVGCVTKEKKVGRTL